MLRPNVNQYHVINHLNGEEMNEQRNVLVESARIARGAIQDIKELNAGAFHGVVFPGGFGTAKITPPGRLTDQAVK